MITAIAAMLAGLILLTWSADRFVEGSSVTARHFGMPPLLIGMIVVGFGTSAPEMTVSALAAMQGTPGIALGNAYGSNIANIALILGVTALINPIMVQSTVLHKELPILTGVTVLSILLVLDLHISRLDATILLLVFCGLMGWTIHQGLQRKTDTLGLEVEHATTANDISIRKAVFWLITGLIFLILSSRLLVWGAVSLAQLLGVTDIIIGLTVVAIGTSLPELASSVIAARRGEHDIALGNVLGSNLFNTLAVVGIAAIIQPFTVERITLTRDLALMTALTVILFALAYGFRGRPGRINRMEGATLLTIYLVYTCYLIFAETTF